MFCVPCPNYIGSDCVYEEDDFTPTSAEIHSYKQTQSFYKTLEEEGKGRGKKVQSHFLY